MFPPPTKVEGFHAELIMSNFQLMLGDLVQGFSDNTFAEILEISHCGRVTISTQDGQTITLNSKDIQPIPLTEEILKKNGLYFGHTSQEQDLVSLGVICYSEEHWVLDEGEGCIIVIDFPNENDGGQISICNTMIDKAITFAWDELFVHELQQALRLAGLTEMANNFKL